MLVFVNHLGHLDENGHHAHLLRDWSGAMIPGNILYPPMEMLYAAAYLRQRGHDVAMVDGNVRHWSSRRSIGAVLKHRPTHAITVSGWYNLQDDLAFFRDLKAAAPEVCTILAGPNVTLDPASALASSAVDYVALGEFIDGVDEIVSGRLARNVAYRADGEVVVRPFVPLEPLDRIPFADWSLVDPHEYWVPFVRQYPFALALTGVGCPHAKCAFCHQISYFGDAHRSHSKEYVIEEASRLYADGFREIIYRDQVFTARRDVVEALCRHLIDCGRKMTFRVSTRVDLVDRELFALMAAAGCYQVSMGLESFSDSALSWCRKNATVEDGTRAVAWAKEAGLEVSGGFIIGLPEDEPFSMRRMLRMLHERRIDFPQFFVLTHRFDRSQWAFVPVHENADLRENKRRMRRLALAFYLDPRFIVRQVWRFAKVEGLRRLPRFMADFLRYFW